jgi:hypothetical protein
MEKKTKLDIIFKKDRLIGLAGNKNTGKTNNLCQLLKEYKAVNPDTMIYVYGMPQEVIIALNKLGIIEVSSLDQLVDKKNCIIVIDEFQKLKLNDRKNKDALNELVDFAYHKDVYIIFSTPNIREFNSIIGGVIEKWLLKSIRLDQCINGSQLKRVVEGYKGRYKSLGSIITEPNELLLINNEREILFDVKYFKEADHKKDLKKLF